MPSPAKAAPAAPDRRARGEAPSGAQPLARCAAAWLVPGAGHVLHGEIQKGAIFFVALIAMFAIGLAFGGRLFPLQISEPLVFLAAVAQWAMALPRLVAALGGFGEGEVVAVTYEYGNTFLIASGLLNTLVVLDAYDLASGRKTR